MMMMTFICSLKQLANNKPHLFFNLVIGALHSVARQGVVLTDFQYLVDCKSL
jgi:hypothetical protein